MACKKICSYTAIIPKELTGDLDLKFRPREHKVCIAVEADCPKGRDRCRITQKCFAVQETDRCIKCRRKLNKKNLCGFHSKPICTNCNACMDCFNGVDTI